MRINPALFSFVILAFPAPSLAHRLDEYLQATTISIEKDRIAVEMRLSPGVAVAPFVLSTIDRNGDGVISAIEEADYVRQLLQDISLTLDGDVLALRLVSKTFARVEDMREGMAEIYLTFFAAVPRQDVTARQLIFENSHQKRIAAYLVNAIVPSDPDIRITAQSRNFQQSSYRLDYSQAGGESQHAWLLALAVLMAVRFGYLWWRRRERRPVSAR